MPQASIAIESIEAAPYISATDAGRQVLLHDVVNRLMKAITRRLLRDGMVTVRIDDGQPYQDQDEVLVEARIVLVAPRKP